MTKRARILIAEDVIYELNGDDYFLELDDPQEPVMPVIFILGLWKWRRLLLLSLATY